MFEGATFRQEEERLPTDQPTDRRARLSKKVGDLELEFPMR
jgi:hypothetical protein